MLRAAQQERTHRDPRLHSHSPPLNPTPRLVKELLNEINIRVGVRSEPLPETPPHPPPPAARRNGSIALLSRGGSQPLAQLLHCCLVDLYRPLVAQLHLLPYFPPLPGGLV